METARFASFEDTASAGADTEAPGTSGPIWTWVFSLIDLHSPSFSRSLDLDGEGAFTRLGLAKLHGPWTMEDPRHNQQESFLAHHRLVAVSMQRR